jgi:hypothetical protein
MSRLIYLHLLSQDLIANYTFGTRKKRKNKPKKKQNVTRIKIEADTIGNRESRPIKSN